MAKFINKKEQVYDLKLTNYGHYLLSVGKFKPSYYTFLDDNVLYDGAYAGLSESQNDIQTRIKDNTQYLESFVLFRNIESGSSDISENENYFEVDVTPTMIEPAVDAFKFNGIIGDAFLDGPTQVAPAWKLVALQSRINSSYFEDTKNVDKVPQINIDLKYRLRAVDSSFNLNPEGIRDVIYKTRKFADNQVIILESDDPVLYVEEMNTEILNENFDVEVYEVLTGSTSAQYDTLQRKYFKSVVPQIENGLMLSPVQKRTTIENLLTTSSVEYYFNVLTDTQVNKKLACRGAEMFNKQSYYVDIDFECETNEQKDIFYDIYGVATEPEICQD
jgi:hypothetical protein